MVTGVFAVETAEGEVRGEAGDFLHMPPGTVYRESNPADRVAEVDRPARDRPGVVNVDGPIRTRCDQRVAVLLPFC